ncbi:hypothetical protein pdam_00014084 [Pocillopora damicornis]|uniref:Uncharacterized protein n=1 Tax=Pocillopora damicornis TaxID=46731 RepID=A0A3M6UNK3_POCDA|nr:hypothetical protein pdam_00014084 [Pocillopora damicornis]
MASTALARHNPPALQRQLISAASHFEDFRQYLLEVFRKQEGQTYQPGLLDATTQDEFDTIVLSLKQPWAERDRLTQ